MEFILKFFNQWWDALNVDLQVFYAIAWVATVVLLLQTILLVFGFGDADGGDIDIDGEAAMDHGDGGHILSVRTIVAFLVGFGWTGVICLKGGLSLPVASILAFACGVALMMGVYLLMRAFYSMRQSGTLNFKNAVGEIGTVYLPIPPARQSPGQVEVMIQGRLMVVDAFSNASEKIANRAKVKVVGTVGANCLLVEPLGAAGEEPETP